MNSGFLTSYKQVLFQPRYLGDKTHCMNSQLMQKRKQEQAQQKAVHCRNQV